MAAGRQFMYTKFRHGGRKAGTGIAHDDYSEESGNRNYEGHRPLVRFSTDGQDPNSLNGPVIIVQEGRKKMPESICVCCGEVIPEGRQVCVNCERGAEDA